MILKQERNPMREEIKEEEGFIEMEPIYEKEINNFKEKEKKVLYPVYFPDKILTLSKKFYDKLNELFSYEIIYLLPNKANVQTIRRIIEFRICPNYNHRLYCSNCFNSRNNFKVTFIYVCHVCQHIYALSGRYNSKKRYLESFEFFKKPK